MSKKIPKSRKGSENFVMIPKVRNGCQNSGWFGFAKLLRKCRNTFHARNIFENRFHVLKVASI